MAAIYRGIEHAWHQLKSQAIDQDRQDNLVLLVGTLATGGILAIQFFWGLPA